MIPSAREEQVKTDMFRSILDPGKNRRPSVETSLHEMIRYKFVVHLHPTLINGSALQQKCKEPVPKNSSATLFSLFPILIRVIPFSKNWNQRSLHTGRSSHMIRRLSFLKITGSFVGADTTDEIRKIYNDIIAKICGTVSLQFQR